MSKIAPTTAVNRYYLTRMEAAKANERLASREGASEETGIDRKRLQRIEIGTLEPYPEEIMLLADAYHAPELMPYYCTHACPIGKRIAPRAELQELDRLTIKFMAAIEGARGTDRTLLQIASDGRLTPEEIPELKRILAAVKQISSVAQELQIYLDKYNGKEEKE